MEAWVLTEVCEEKDRVDLDRRIIIEALPVVDGRIPKRQEVAQGTGETVHNENYAKGKRMIHFPYPPMQNLVVALFIKDVKVETLTLLGQPPLRGVTAA